MTTAIDYRLMQAEDLHAVQELWEAETEWGPFEPMFRHWHRENPCPGSFVVVAIGENGGIVGQCSFIAMPVMVSGRTIRAVRMFAPVLARTLRRTTPGASPLEPIVGLCRHGLREMRNHGYNLVFGLPDPRWRGFRRWFPELRFASFPLWSLPLPLATPIAVGEGFTSRPLAEWDARVDRLWDATANFAGCSIVRDSRTLRWKTAGLTVTAVERHGELKGVVAAGAKGEKPRQWEIYDIIAADAGESLAATLASAINVGRAAALQSSPELPITQIALLVTPMLQAHVHRFGFRRDAWDFPLMLYRVDDTLSDADIDAARWHLSAND